MRVVTSEGKDEGRAAGGAIAWQPGLQMHDPAYCVVLMFSMHA